MTKKKNKNKQRQKRAARKAQRQRKRAEVGAPPRPGGKLTKVKPRIFGSLELAIRVSGRAYVLIAADMSPKESYWIHGSCSLAGLGYKGSTEAHVEMPIDEIFGKGVLAFPGGLRPMSHDEALRLVAGMHAWAAFRDGLDEGEKEGSSLLEALGGPPSGSMLHWENFLEDYFTEHQLAVANLLAEDPLEHGGPSIDRPDKEVFISFVCSTEKPISTAAALDQHPMEFVPDLENNGYRFFASGAEESPLAGGSRAEIGAVMLKGDLLYGMARSTIAAAVLAERLEALAPSPLSFVDVKWEPLESESSSSLIL